MSVTGGIVAVSWRRICLTQCCRYTGNLTRGGSKSADPSRYFVERTTMFRRFLREDKGQDMVEYGLLAAFISIVAIAALQAIGPLVNAVYTAVQNALASA